MTEKPAEEFDKAFLEGLTTGSQNVLIGWIDGRPKRRWPDVMGEVFARLGNYVGVGKNTAIGGSRQQ